jgi:hypothetical protein
MCGAFEPLPSPLMGEGAGEDRTSSRPIPTLCCQTGLSSPADVNDRAPLGVRLGLTKHFAGDWCDIALTEQNEPQ